MANDRGKKDEQKAWCECQNCRQNTKHTILASVSDSGFVEGPDISYSDDYAIVRCDGCETICFRHEHSNSEDMDYRTGRPEVSVKTYPEASPEGQTGAAYITDEVYSMPGIVQTIYSETLGAIRHGLPVLAGIGIRAIVEATCHDQKATGKDLQKKIDNLVTKSLLTEKGAEILHGIRLIGNIAAHQLKAPSREQVEAAMKVIDHLLIGAYVIPNEAKVLPKPPKKPAAATKPKSAASNSTASKSSKKSSAQAKQGGKS